MTPKTLICVMCRAEFTGRYGTKYCADCRLERARKAQREYCQRHAERKSEQAKIAYWQNPELFRARSREYQRRIRAKREAKLKALLAELAQRNQSR